MGVPAFNVCIVFYMLWDYSRVAELIPWECLHSTVVVHFTCFGTMSVSQSWFLGSTRTLCLYGVLHAVIRSQGNNVDSLGVPTFNVCMVVFDMLSDDSRVTQMFTCVPTFNFCIVFFMLWDALRVTTLTPCECSRSMFAFCFACLETISGYCPER